MRYILLFLFVSSLSLGYTQTVRLNNGEELSGLRVQIGSFKTNEDKVTFLDSTGSKLVIPASDLKEYIWKGRFYYSKIAVGKQEAKIIKILLHGPISLAESIDRFGNKTFYFIIGDEIHALDEYKFEIDVKMVELMDHYADFRAQYTKKIFYDAKSLIVMVSNYNSFIDRGVYFKRRIDYEQKPTLNFMAAYNLNKIKDSSQDFIIKQNYSYSLGILLHNRYSPRASFQASLFYTKSVSSSPVQIVKINSISLDPSILIVAYRNKSTVVWVGPYLNAQFHFYSSIEQFGLPFMKGILMVWELGGMLIHI